MQNNSSIRLAHSCLSDTSAAVAAFFDKVSQPDMELVLFFCSSEYDLDLLAKEVNRLFDGVQVVGCTTAGEIGPAGYLQHSLSGVSFSRQQFTIVSGVLSGLKQFELSQGHDCVQGMLQQLESKVPHADGQNSFAFMMIDGLSMAEEVVTHSLQHSLGDIRMVGGSAGDDQKFISSSVFSDGQFHDDSAVVVVINTCNPFTLFKTQHFVSSNERLVVTEADTTQRIVKEINGFPAAQEYSRLVGVAVSELDSMRFAESPVVVLIDGTDYVRSIQKVNADGSLTFYCAIEEGVVFRVAHGVSLVKNLQETFETLNSKIGRPQLVIGCDCILRNLEVRQRGLQSQVERLFKENNTIGFSSYGEQYGGVHINQTLTGVVIGEADNAE
ncbi:nitric oxide-sensing protein NosP [Amphritea pacifica]|uniref:nitric oxide-sensing protein NosP n=1 Tax=Amphritea pacifica TaxID=2811233 RepID=UPI001962A4B1|nr:nitric oxide-sensing protein NosP [Amphritea pacifica]MBN1008857.1 FIST C-terminal domain-containing protein [Amphritea pacifica]